MRAELIGGGQDIILFYFQLSTIDLSGDLPCGCLPSKTTFTTILELSGHSSHEHIPQGTPLSILVLKKSMKLGYSLGNSHAAMNLLIYT